MNARKHVKTAAHIAANAEQLVFSSHARRKFNAESYWQACEQRLQCWNRVLALFKEDLKNKDGHKPWPAMKIVIEEILFSEVLTRVWTALMAISDREESDREMDAILRAVWIGHLAARAQALVLIYNGQQAGSVEADELDALRRRLERWSDILLSRLGSVGDVEQYSFDPERVRDWSEERRRLSPEQNARQWELLVASLQRSIDDKRQAQAANPDVNRAIEQTISSCLPSFQPVDDPRSEASMPWLRRMNETADTMETLIREYISHAG